MLLIIIIYLLNTSHELQGVRVEKWQTHSSSSSYEDCPLLYPKAPLAKRVVAPLLPMRVDRTMLLYSRKSRKDIPAYGLSCAALVLTVGALVGGAYLLMALLYCRDVMCYWFNKRAFSR
jgi:hypothetical protein